MRVGVVEAIAAIFNTNYFKKAITFDRNSTSANLVGLFHNGLYNGVSDALKWIIRL